VRLLAAERRTGELAGVPYGCLDAAERRELADLAQAAYERQNRTRPGYRARCLAYQADGRRG
jgi:hypothetical protein